MKEQCSTNMSRRRTLVIILLSILIVVTFHLRKDFFRVHLEDIVIYDMEKDVGTRDPLVTCKFPIVHPFDKSVLKYVSPANPVRCTERTRLLTYIDALGVVRFNQSALAEAGYNDEAELDCDFSEIERGDNDFSFSYLPPRRIVGEESPASDFILVQCRSQATGHTVYSNFHAHAQKRSRVRRFRSDTEMGVVVVGIDSLSRLNFMRQMPTTFRLITGVMGGTVMIGFNKVGLNTLPNLGPMLTGRPLPKPPYHKFKDWPFIWNDFADAGAATMYAEDQPAINMFDYLEEGVDKQPTDHYMRPFWLAVEGSFLYRMSSPYCLGPLPSHVVFYSYLKSFLRTYRDSPVFLFSLINELSHNYLNTVGAMDEDVAKFLKSSWEEGLFNRSLVLVLGDHGNRVDKFRGTEQGRLEDQMPLVAAVLPSWAPEEWRRALSDNSRRLTSTFDIFGAFSDVLQGLGGLPRPEATSSLLRRVPLNRTCSDAGIPDVFCSCAPEQGVEALDPGDTRVSAAATATVLHLNLLLRNVTRYCATLSLHQVQSSTINNVKNKIHLRLTVEPSKGQFESTVDISGKEWKVEGEVVRTNRYGKQSACLPKHLLAPRPQLREICFCS